MTSGSLTVLRAAEVPVTGAPYSLDRHLLAGADAEGLASVVEHVLQPGILAAPLHRHSREDEYSVVLAGTLGVFEDGEWTTATAGDLVRKPRGRWHTFWNAGEDELRVLEIIVPGGLDVLFRRLGDAGGEFSPEDLPALAAEFGCDVDFEGTEAIIREHGLEL